MKKYNRFKNNILKNKRKFFVYILLFFCLIFFVSCKNYSKWQEEKFVFNENKLSYKEDVKNAKMLAPFIKKENNSNVVYQVLVYSFADGNNDGIGDFIGLKEKINYFVDLKIDQIYLSPIHPSSSYHGYDVINYTEVAKELGGKEAFLDFLKTAHENGIKVYMDMVFNHTSFEHPWFQQALKGEEKYKNFYHFYDNKVNDSNQDTRELRDIFINLKDKNPTNHFYTSKFWAGMPDLNLDNSEVIEELKAIQKYWTKLGVDGFRYDAFDEFFSSYGESQNNFTTSKIFYELRKASNEGLKETNQNDKEIFMMGEWWKNPLEAKKYFTYQNNKALDTVYDSTHWKNNWFINKNINEIQNFLKEYKPNEWVPFLSNHDNDRWINSYRTNVSKLFVNDLDKPLTNDEKEAIKSAYFALLIHPAKPIIYHGDELGMHANKKFGDPGLREPFKWKNSKYNVSFSEAKSNDKIFLNFSNDIENVENQINNKDSIYNTIKFLNEFRGKNPFLFSSDNKTISNANEYIDNKNIAVTFIRNDLKNEKKFLFLYTNGKIKNDELILKKQYKNVVFNYKVKIENNKIFIKHGSLLILEI
ncbi:alpha-amylase family glycosyl hydrolase [[Mycoplasma] collis]|uniref:alpha-amylase family glycosyl hydrolase n=1 Tax=[Mycoplasma] collis TaxID=2127 RepID=UPI00068D958C|nr:alpha-amylase family glycosyl hydrolase [[Mycoplasma] collis]